MRALALFPGAEVQALRDPRERERRFRSQSGGDLQLGRIILQAELQIGRTPT
jgi:hypothetical protein